MRSYTNRLEDIVSEFMELAPCPDCESEVQVAFVEDDVQLACTGCGRVFGKGAPAREARTLCVYWNLLLGEPSDVGISG
jgi:ribosomal protein S27E